jgi:hypothetical protein
LKNKCCKHYEEKKACKDCPILAELRLMNKSIKRKEVRHYLVHKKQKEEVPAYA